MTPANWLQLALALLGVAQACLLVSVVVVVVRVRRLEARVDVHEAALLHRRLGPIAPLGAIAPLGETP